jgi:integral membrane protein
VTSQSVPVESETPAPPAHGLLVQYRVMAFTTAVLLIILVFVGIPLQAAADRPEVVNVVGTLHGFLYIVYLVAAFRLTIRLKIPVWQMILVLLAGTVPFAAFFAERKMTKRFDSETGSDQTGARSARNHRLQDRWMSRRAVVLHLEVLVVAPGCIVAGWWQATRALAGNGLSWIYSIEWPLFALLAIWGWWHLIHEDPDAYRKRRLRIEATQSAV